MGALFNSFNIGASGMNAQSKRMNAITENIANADVTKTENGTPFKRKLVRFIHNQDGSVTSKVVDIKKNPFKEVYSPGHPDADKNGFVTMPNVDPVKEMIDLNQSSRSFESNLATLEASKRMLLKTINLLR